MNDPRYCSCLPPSGQLRLHDEKQNTDCDAWKRLLDLIEQTVEDGLEELDPRRDMKENDWLQISTLPPGIAKLK